MAGTFTNLLYHIVFSTKNRAPTITPTLRDELFRYVGGIIRGEGGILLEIGGMPDHVHLLARIKADISVAEMVRKIKAHSSKWTNQRPGSSWRFEWQAGYGAFSVSESQVAAVQDYIHNHGDHHKIRSFQDEFRELLKNTGSNVTNGTSGDDGDGIESSPHGGNLQCFTPS